MVGATGFEPATTCTPSKCATRLRYAPARVQRGQRRNIRPWSRQSRKRASGALVQSVLQHLRRPEREDAAGGDLDLLSGLRVAADTGLLLAHHEVPEPGKLDLFAALQRVLQRVEHHLDDLGGLLLGEPDFAAHAVDDVSLGHAKTLHGHRQLRQTPKEIALSRLPDAMRLTNPRMARAQSAAHNGAMGSLRMPAAPAAL